MSHKIHTRIKVFDPEEEGREVVFKDLEELRIIMESWLLNSKIIQLAYGTTEIIYVMTNDRIAEHLRDGNMGDDFKKYGRRHLRAKKILAVLADLD
tara:strand:- start:3549 stop:3836 length:288 start_codon:yes stop_codon:yes gene_type:complete